MVRGPHPSDKTKTSRGWGTPNSSFVWEPWGVGGGGCRWRRSRRWLRRGLILSGRFRRGGGRSLRSRVANRAGPHPSRKNKCAARVGHPRLGWVTVRGTHPSDKNKDVARVGHPRLSWVTVRGTHPSDKNKDVARVGHPRVSWVKVRGTQFSFWFCVGHPGFILCGTPGAVDLVGQPDLMRWVVGILQELLSLRVCRRSTGNRFRRCLLPRSGSDESWTSATLQGEKPDREIRDCGVDNGVSRRASLKKKR